jgi:ABC-type molybdenum transport system ATPase subunit/photorepair protein PhrA
MPLRVDQITLPAGSPLGACSLQGLEGVDLVIVTGPNGSGKTTLLSPLDAPGATTGTVGCIVDGDARQNYAAQGVQRSITFIRSMQLLDGFQDLSQALGLAANTVRLQHEAQLLRQLARQAKRDAASTIAVSEPRQITDLKNAYLSADGKCGSRPRTVSEYNRLGATLAGRAHAAWTPCQPTGPSMDRLEAEEAVRPRAQSLAGLPEFSQAIARLPSHLENSAAPTSAAARSEAAALKVAASLEEALAELPEHGRQVPRAPGTAAEADAVVAALKAASRSMQAALEAKDALGQCRAIASGYLQAQAKRGIAVDACPVCAQPIDASQLDARLSAPAAEGDPESKVWRAARQRFDALAQQVESDAHASAMASAQAAAEHAGIRTPIRACMTALQAPVAQHAASVTAARTTILQRCNDWLANFEKTAPSSAAVTAAGAVVVQARRSLEALQAEERALNDGLVQAQQDFSAFQALGIALAARATLDATPWDLALDEVQAAARRQLQRDRWISVLNRMADAREAQASIAQSTVVNDPGVQARFTALVSRVPHPAVQTLRYQGSAVTRAGAAAHDQLSEGQTALVNIAAAIAVAGKVAGATGHPPGWIAFDEPTNGLDDAARYQVAEYLGGMTTQDLPCQIFVATFDEDFADRLQRAALAAGRRVRRVRMQPFRSGQPCNPQIEDLLPN